MTLDEYKKLTSSKKTYSKPPKEAKVKITVDIGEPKPHMFSQSKISEAINRICIKVPGRAPMINYHENRIEVQFDEMKFELKLVK